MTLKLRRKGKRTYLYAQRKTGNGVLRNMSAPQNAVIEIGITCVFFNY